ncbi:ribosome maturation factor RimM [Thiothrix lacustris]|jgi:16S rRNA processing protein RimM|uniref:Ribosome maturation factor RimM n=1 Tax=Thiothrix lacustris TaxID=525917 RepID=A0ABY9MMZ2_9GAMM|nr:ribosome maturation factor RimM [Thiothrix lacustris]WML89892.1 ribosome maturation factor RimM [Thiothrix lacustris]WMP18502.1 ribosome maturation factor RimM [Thiothrix lacustris]
MSQLDMVTLGKISAVFGIKGWVKVFSHTHQLSGILDYAPWSLKVGGEWKPCKLLNGQVQGKGIVAQLDGVTDRTQAEKLIGCEIGIPRDRLHKLDDDEYYWADLIGMEVVTVNGVVLGTVDHLFETGANDVLVVQGERERLLPWVLDTFIKSVSLAEKRITVDWDPDF